MKKLITILTVTFLFILSPIFGQWEYHLIDNLYEYTACITTGDIESDGDIDMVVAEYNADILSLYVNNDSTWKRYTVDSYIDGVLGVDIADFDKDGNPDILAAACYGDYIAWYKNDGGDPINWTRNIIDVFDGALVAWAEDFNGDGAVDACVNGFVSGEVFWYENNLPAGWIKHFIGSKIAYGNYTVGDINEDGKPDILGATHNVSGGSADVNKVVLYLNNLPDPNWTEIIIDDNLYGAFDAHFGDIDNDGDIDVAATNQLATGSNADVMWYENDGTELVWTKHTICTDMANARTLDIADVDNDGYMDVMAGDATADDVILFRNEDGGQNWTKIIIDDNYRAPNTMWFSDVDLDGDLDLTLSTESDDVLVWYENHSPGTAYPESLEVNPYSIQSQNDTMTVLTSMNNPESHTASAFAVIQGEQFAFIDTLQLFDDGLHNDGDSADNIWGNIKLSSGLPEDSYSIDLFTYDSIYDVSFTYHPPGKFINFGPVAYEDYSFNNPGDTVFSPGESLYIRLVLANNSSTATATNIKAGLVSLDTLVSVLDYLRSFDNITAGGNTVSKSTFRIKIDEGFPVNKQAGIIVNIYCYDHISWTDTFFITILEPVNLEDIREPITRIYPNPTDDMLNIEISNTGKQGLEIEILDITGTLIYYKKFTSSGALFNEQINLSGYTKGIYLLKVRQANTIYIGKVVVK